MTMVDLIIYAVIGGGLIWIFVTLQRSAKAGSKIESPQATSALPASNIASVLLLLGVIAILLGLVMLTQEGVLQAALLVGAAISMFAMGFGLQYLFDVRNILLQNRKDRDDA